MKTSRFTESQIIATLKQADACQGHVSQGWDQRCHLPISVEEQIRWSGSLGTAPCAGVGGREAKLKRIYAELLVDIVALKDVISQNSKPESEA